MKYIPRIQLPKEEFFFKEKSHFGSGNSFMFLKKIPYRKSTEMLPRSPTPNTLVLNKTQTRPQHQINQSDGNISWKQPIRKRLTGQAANRREKVTSTLSRINLKTHLFFHPDRPSVHTIACKTGYPHQNDVFGDRKRNFWKRFPKWINLKKPARRV